MLIPLVVLAFSMVAGFVGVPPVLGGGNHIEQFPDAGAHEAEERVRGNVQHRTRADGGFNRSRACGLPRISVLCREAGTARKRLATSATPCTRIMLNKYYVDEIYDAMIVWPWSRRRVSSLEIRGRHMIDGAVNGVGSWFVEAPAVCGTCRRDMSAPMRLDSAGRRSGRRLV